MIKKKYKSKKLKRYSLYIKKKRFYRKFGRKLNTLLNKKTRKSRQYKNNLNKKNNYKTKKPKVIVLPIILSLEKAYRNEFLRSITELQQYLPSKDYKCSIDHSKIKRIDPEALLVLAAEIKRSVSNKGINHLKYNKRYAPKNEQVLRMLNSIGYWEHFNIHMDSNNDRKRRFLKISHDIIADNSHVVDLRDFFNRKLNFLPLHTTEMFDNAISEAIANSVEHAYIKEQKLITIKRAWWLSGSYNMETKELCFGCYDQGIGVKEALGHHDDRLIMKWIEKLNLKAKNDSDVIETLVNEELPKYNNTDRGHGFKHFIKFIEDYTYGSLNIYSNKGEYNIFKEEDSIIKTKYDYEDTLNGTLIVWKIKLEGELK